MDDRSRGVPKVTPPIRGVARQETTLRASDDAADDTLISEAQAAALLSVAQRTLQGWRRNGAGPGFVRLTARSVRYRRADLVAWVSARLESGKQ
jgi:predicted DNA-binding transcriptional regulator AlpA